MLNYHLKTISFKKFTDHYKILSLVTKPQKYILMWLAWCKILYDLHWNSSFKVNNSESWEKSNSFFSWVLLYNNCEDVCCEKRKLYRKWYSISSTFTYYLTVNMTNWILNWLHFVSLIAWFFFWKNQQNILRNYSIF